MTRSIVGYAACLVGKQLGRPSGIHVQASECPWPRTRMQFQTAFQIDTGGIEK